MRFSPLLRGAPLCLLAASAPFFFSTSCRYERGAIFSLLRHADDGEPKMQKAIDDDARDNTIDYAEVKHVDAADQLIHYSFFRAAIFAQRFFAKLILFPLQAASHRVACAPAVTRWQVWGSGGGYAA